MRLDVYQEETAQIARYQSEILAEARKKLAAGEMLSHLEQNGILHALQVLVENAIGKTQASAQGGRAGNPGIRL
jgi:predicted transcriptional regulator